ncbi:MAG: hypothetical protein ABIG44_06910 [Planctomycetota bacterium]
MDERSRHCQFEDQFHSQLRTRAETLIRGKLPADQVVIESMPDGRDSVRATLNRLGNYNRNLLDQMPGMHAVQMTFRRRVLGGLFKRTVTRVRALALSPTESLVANESAGPVGREQVLDALARYDLLPRRERPRYVIFASATGFTPEANSLVHSHATPGIILMGGREDGGWDVEMPNRVRVGPWARLLELESQDDRLRRLQYHLKENAVLLDSRGISIPELAGKLGLSPEQTDAVVRRACRADSRLMTVVHQDQVHLCRTPLRQESGSMSIWSKIRKWLRLKPTVAERVAEYTAKRVSAEQQRQEIDQKIDTLETDEREALKQGAAAKSKAEQQQVANRLMRVRRDLRRLRSQATVYTQQIDILGTHIHNLTMAEQGRRMELPKAEELTAQAAEAEGVVSELATNAELAAGIEVSAQTPAMEDEQDAILAEFAEMAEQQASSEKTEEPTVAESAPEDEPASATPDSDSKTKDQEKAGPELG